MTASASCLVRAGIPGLDAFAAMASEIHYIAAQLGQASGQAWMLAGMVRRRAAQRWSAPAARRAQGQARSGEIRARW